MPTKIVVGGVRTPSGIAAVRWGHARAAKSAIPLVVVHAIDLTQRADLALTADLEQECRDSRARVQHWVADALDGDASDVIVRIETPLAPRLQALARASRDADLVVVGKPDMPEDSQLPELVADRVDCPVVVVAAEGRATRVLRGRVPV